MKNLIIIGARGFGRELSDFAKDCEGYGKEFLLKGFLDDNEIALDGFQNYPNILGSVEDYVVQENDVFICGLGSLKWSEYYTKIIISKGGIFINLIHQEAVIRSNVVLGIGNVIGKGTLISTDVKIGNFTQIMTYCILGHDVIVGENCRIGDYSFLGGFTQVEDNVFIAVRATVLDRIKIKTWSTIGAGSVVIKNVAQNTTVFGNPAKKIEF
ncbi:MAG: acetyltransferase [Bacteroidota bacterium]